MKKNIAVLFGGCSDEHEISLKSASAVIRNIDKQKYNIIPIGISKEGECYYYSELSENIVNSSPENSRRYKALFSPDRKDRGVYIKNDNIWDFIKIDAAFPVMHGKNGEDGTLQGLIELSGTPLIGCDTLCSALCMDKHKSHIIAEACGIRTPKACLIENSDDLNEAYNLLNKFGKAAVKPVKSGSSLGVNIIKVKSCLEYAVKEAFKYDTEVLIEEFIQGNEVGCAVIGNNNLIIGEVDEVELNGANFDFNEKYNTVNSEIYLPARVSSKKRQEIKNTAIKIYKALGCRGFARVDMFFTPESEIVFNEVNTIPGFTENSRFPKMMQAAGYSMEKTVQSVIDTAKF